MGIVDGMPGSLSDNAVMVILKQIMDSNCPNSDKFTMLDNLTYAVWNNHEYGMAADVLRNVENAYDSLLDC